MTALQVLGSLLVLAGSIAGVIGALGLLRMPDFFSRIHAAGITDTFCAGALLVGLALLSPSLLVASKLLMVLFFLLFTTPTATHALARAALKSGLKPVPGYVRTNVPDEEHLKKERPDEERQR